MYIGFKSFYENFKIWDNNETKIILDEKKWDRLLD